MRFPWTPNSLSRAMHFEHLFLKKVVPERLHVAAVLVKIEARPFAAGAMRECYAMKKLSTFSSSVYRWVSKWRRRW